jgi:hypothetical protein
MLYKKLFQNAHFYEVSLVHLYEFKMINTLADDDNLIIFLTKIIENGYKLYN